MSWDALGALPSTLESGRAGVYDLHPDGLFPYLEANPDQAAVFDHAMTSKSHADIPLILDAFDFGAHRSVADIAGGRGHLLRAIRDRLPDVTTTLFERPDVVDRVAAEGDLGGMTLVAGDFFTDTLPEADVYVLMEIIHDWDDADSVRILEKLRRHAPDGATLLIVETVLDEGRLRDPARTLDIVMLALTGGRERTPAEYGVLLDRAGWRFQEVVPTGGGVQLVVARTAG
jgi:C-methyltransferase